MRRREFITFVGSAAVAWPPKVRAQQPATQHRIAIFHPAIPTTLLTETGGGSAWRAFFGELRRLGYVEGGNLIIERYSAEGHHERYTDIAREIVTRRPDVIVTGTNPVVTAFNAETRTIPVVAFMLDPLHANLVTNLSRPAGHRHYPRPRHRSLGKTPGNFEGSHPFFRKDRVSWNARRLGR
jgi:putative ABC transport system substrate-binding protein